MNKGFEKLFIDKAKQEIYYKFDEKGASLRSAAGIGISGLSKKVKNIIFNKTIYFLSLKKLTAQLLFIIIY